MRMDEEEISAMSPHPRCAGDALHLLPLPSPASPVSITHHSCLVVVTRDLSPPSSLPILPFILRLARAQSFPARVSSAPYPARSLLPGPSASFSDTAFLPNPYFPFFIPHISRLRTPANPLPVPPPPKTPRRAQLWRSDEDVASASAYVARAP
ncbi:hypothetical protein DFH09DRAFT_1367113 [Mycena vulgaris]|nr:hypothetical protein DFH09DRAFT_1367113 [Mycena vulgaris]